MSGRSVSQGVPTTAQQHCSGRHSLLCLWPVIQRHLPKPFAGGEGLTRDYRCRMFEELADLVFEWPEQGVPFEVERDVYNKRPTVRVQHFAIVGSCLIALRSG